MTLSIVILAAGKGKRMHSQIPKVLHPLGGKSLIEHVVTTAQALNPSNPPIIVIGHEGEKVRKALEHHPITWVEQKEQLGTGHALLQALPNIPDSDSVLVLCGDTPLISVETLQRLISATPKNAIGIITAKFPNPSGLGRIVRDSQNNIIQIIEEKDANETFRNIQEINSGFYFIPAKFLKTWLPTLNNTNAQKEYYLTDIIAKSVKEKTAIHSVQPRNTEEVYGINDRAQLAILERFYQKQLAEKLMREGVTLLDPNRFDVRGELTIGQDVTIDVNVIFEGSVTIGSHCIIGPNCILKNALLADGVEIKANSIIEGAEIAEKCVIGPFARIRPDTKLSPNVHIGNFVEIKKSWVDTGTKINHLSYVGDSEIGSQVNIGAGTITCNYDGANKHKTIIGNNVFIGSNSQLVAPVQIGEGATIGAGSTITQNAPANQLTICRAKQITIENWQRPKKEKET